MSWQVAILLGLVEGLTEFLPVSSTGHLILLGERLGAHDEAQKTLEVVIQLGAVLALVAYFRVQLGGLVAGVIRREAASLRLLAALAAAFVPTAAAGLLLHETIKASLFGTGPVVTALVAGGVLMLVIEGLRKRRGPPKDDSLADVTPARAFSIGLAQCVSLWPGASRSMTTIVGGQLCGLSTKTAAEFSFLLAIPTLGAATLFDLAKGGKALLAAPGGASALAVGLTVSFAVALVVIAAFLRYLRSYGLAPFGAYRIVLGLAVLFIEPSPTTAAPTAAAAAPPTGDAGTAPAVEPAAAREPAAPPAGKAQSPR